MNIKKILILLIGAVILIVAIFTIFDIGSIDLSLNIKKYHTFTTDTHEFTFYGSFGRIHKINIYEDGEKLCSVKLDIDADIFEDSESDAVIYCDINSDDISDILVLQSIDQDGDEHRRLFIGSEGDFDIVGDIDAVNARMEDGLIISEHKDVRYLAQTVEEYTVPYESSITCEKYGMVDGYVTLLSRTVLSYYSESDIYCFGTFEYNDELGELMYIDEEWLLPDEYSEQKDIISKYFTIELP